VRLLHDMGRTGRAQFVIASHSPILLACRESKIYSFDHMPIQEIEYEKTEYYQIYRSFMEDRRKYLDQG
jgi:predicted ATPase